MSKTLVAYFSASGTTKKVAEKLAEAVNGDLFEIEPEVKYTSEDLDWTNKQSRSTIEMNDPASRPAIKNKPDITGYDRIFVGFPIWWYREPSIIDTFMESADFSGKKVIPFATSGSSQIGSAYQNLQKIAPEAQISEGKRFPSNVGQEELKKWAEQL